VKNDSARYRLTMVKLIRVVQFGVGPIGARIAKLAHEKGLSIVGAIDIDPDKVGKDLGEVIGTERLDVRVSNDARSTLRRARPDVVFHATTSSLRLAMGQIEIVAKAGADMISTCEELVYPKAQHPELAKRIDRVAKRYGITVLGTGVNPGFVMDTLVIALSGVCQEVKRIKAIRMMDASTRRLPFQRKIGAGMTVEQFKAKVAQGGFGHVGLRESLSMIAEAIGWKLDEVKHSIEPVIADTACQTEFFKVEPNQVAGLRQIVEGMRGGEPVIILDFRAYVGARDPKDRIIIEGLPPIDLTVQAGIHGDYATAAIAVNAVPRVIAHCPGLVTMKDIPVPAAWLAR